jgi:hypothetical protein
VLIRWGNEIRQSYAAGASPEREANAAAVLSLAAFQNYQQPDYQRFDRNSNTHGANKDTKDEFADNVDQINDLGNFESGVNSGIPDAKNYAVLSGANNRVDAAIQQIYSYAEIEAHQNAKMLELTNRLIELEEENIEFKGKLEQANARTVEMKALVEVVMGDEQQLKTKATQQLTKIRLNLESEHAEELRKVRQSYESERNRLLGEMDAVARAVEEAKLSSGEAASAWDRLAMGEGVAQSSINLKTNTGKIDLKYGTQPRPTPPRVYLPTPPYNNGLHLDEAASVNAGTHKTNVDDGDEAEDVSTNVKAKRMHNSKKNVKHHKKHSKNRKQRRKKNGSSSSSSSEPTSGASSSDSSSSDSSSDDSGDDSFVQLNSVSVNQKKSKHHDQRTRRTVNPNSSSIPEQGSSLHNHNVHSVAHGRHPMDVRLTPSSAGDRDGTVSGSGIGNESGFSLSYINQQQDLAEVQVENLERALEMERRKHAETKFEVDMV